MRRKDQPEKREITETIASILSATGMDDECEEWKSYNLSSDQEDVVERQEERGNNAL